MRPSSRTPWVIAAAAILLTVVATSFVALTTRARDEARFENAVQSTRDRIAARLGSYVTLLRGVSSLMSAEDTASLSEFRAYVAGLEVESRYPGIQGIGFAQRIAPADTARLAAELRGAGLPDFHVWPSGERTEYHPIVYLEPLDRRNRAALGYDMFTDPTRRAAMSRARDSGRAALSGRVFLKQDIEGRRQPGFLIYLPVYRGGAVPGTIRERREALRGFVYSPFHAGDLFAGIFGSERAPRVAFRVYDGAAPREADLLHDSGEGVTQRSERPEFTAVRQVVVAGRPWTVGFSSLPAFENASGSYLVPLTAAAGALITLLLYGLARSDAAARSVAERSARETVQLAGQLQDNAAVLQQRAEESEALAAELSRTNRELAEAGAFAEAARSEAEEANLAKSHFLATMSHELRTPLNAIGGYTELLDFGVQGPVNDGQRGYLTRIKRAQEHLLGLINDVLNFAQLEAGRVAIALADVPLDGVLADAESLIIPQAEAKGIAYRRVARHPSELVRADRQKVQQILLNLLSNATKFTDPGGEIRLGYERRDGGVDVHVADTGSGVPADRLEAIFDPFVQLGPNPANASHGVGLGLAISRELARSMGGDVTVRSAPGLGSTFTLRLPAVAAVRDDPEPLAAAPRASAAPEIPHPGGDVGER